MKLADRYRVVRRVGEGGLGGIYLVRDRLADEAPMVLKRLHPSAQSSLASWLANEFQILAQLDLPTVAGVYDFGLAEADAEDPGGTFFTRAFVDGEPLAAGSSSDPTRVARWFASAADTLHTLHRLGVVHGDLKPANVIVPHGANHVVLIDFGLAHGALGGMDRVRGGTLAFMPPERRAALLAGDAVPADPRADVYGLAATLRAVLEGAPSLPAWQSLRDVATRGTADVPTQRFASADELLVALGGGVAGSWRTPSRVVLRPEGRESELGALLEAIDERLLRARGQLASVLVRGEPGSGRSTLFRELTWRVQLRGVQVLAMPGEGGVRRLADGLGVLSGSALGAITDESLSNAARRAAQAAPLLILIDDIDRGDAGLAARLRSLAYAIEPHERVLVMASATSEQAVSAFAPGRTVTLGPLDESAVGALCTQLLGAVEPDVASAVRERSGGLPRAVTALLHVLAGSGGVTAADALHAEVARDSAERDVASLADEVVDTVAALRALGSPSTAVTLERVGAGRAIEVARARGVIRARPDGRLEVSRAEIGDAAVARLEGSQRAALFVRVATFHEDAGSSASLRMVAWLQAGDAVRARAVFPAARAEAVASGLPGEAARWAIALRALDPESDTETAQLGDAELLDEAGANDEARRLFERLVDASEAGVSSRARRYLAGVLSRAGAFDRARALLAEGLARNATGDAAAELHLALAMVDVRSGAYASSVAHAEEGLSHAGALSLRAALLAREGLARSYQGDHTVAVQRLESALALYATVDLPRDEAQALAYLAIARDRQGELSAAHTLYERTLQRARAAGDVAAMASARLNLGGLLDRQGDLASALEHFAAAAKLARRGGDAHGALVAQINTAGDLMRVGALHRAEAELDAVLGAARTLGAQELVAHATGMLGVVHAQRGDLDVGLAGVREARDRFQAMGSAEGAAEADLDVAEILLDRGGDADRAAAVACIANARSAGGETETFVARLALLDARVALARGEARAALAQLGDAIDRATRGSEWEVLARALGVRATAHEAMGAEVHARRDRERALEVLERTASVLPPDLRSAFWTVAWRVALRTESSHDGSMHGAWASVAGTSATVIAHDQRLVLLLDLSRRMAEEHTVERVLEQAVRSAVELTNAERGAILLVGPDGTLSMRAHSGVGRDDGPDDQFSRSIAETVLIDGEPVATHNARGDKRFADFRSVHDLALTAVAAVPMRARGRALGVLYVENRLRRTRWSPADVTLMQSFAEHAGLAVEHARVIEQLEERTRELEAARVDIEQLLETRTAQLESTMTSLERAEEALHKRYAPSGMVGQTEAMRKVFAVIDRVKDSDVPVVIEGESGTGKEMVARAIHFAGGRKKGPFVVVHCGAIPETLLEGELFGHVKGAFTGAERDRVGLIASANGGTLLLDEVAEMPGKMQVDLLRVLQERVVRRVGGDHDERIDVRVLVATHRPMLDLVRDGIFREDLYYRLSVVTLSLPPLRARIEDVPTLASHMLARIAEEHGTARKRLDREALQRLLRAPWPGNVRQLRHVLESAAVLGEGAVITADELTLPDASRVVLHSTTSPPERGASPLAVRRASERQRIVDALDAAGWNKVKAATVLGMPRRTLYRRLREYGLLDE